VTTIAPITAAPAETKQHAQARTTAQAFEAVLIGQMTQLMMESAGDPGEFSGGHGEAMFSGVLAEKIGVATAQRGGIGLAPAIMAKIIELQGQPE
jgi:Rod binding domain-containing protein